MSKIPIKNLYYMLTYAWDILDEADKIQISKDSYEQDLDFLGSILNSSVNYQLKRGLYKDYLLRSEQTATIKGKINFSDSLKKQTFLKCQAICEFDEYTEDNQPNRIIKTALYRVFCSDNLCPKLAIEIKNTLSILKNVSLLSSAPKDIETIRLPKNFQFYKLLLSVSSFILTNTSQNESNGKYEFIDFIRSPHKMRKLYEKFVYNFYQKELSGTHKVENSKSQYVGIENSLKNSKTIPYLITDIELVSLKTGQRIIIDTKFEKETLTKNMYGQEKIHSKYLMQLMTYLENRRRSCKEKAIGILLYPTIDQTYEVSNNIWDYNIHIMNIDLSEDWSSIKSNLINLITKVEVFKNTYAQKAA
ncbi:McrBC 5-methylcytosine restriction system component [Bacteriovorax sp. BAL6_X]|uniref:5-methylcytosine restriction system specificity protein McrC n=1 Tax=Bacteriovorax sp. BAL6_X TaxID=1201290 RepID=UPI000385F2F2|nr:McrBC 5-methylcytosine restriction system component [Bacteriovorax sp. BAL6_X]EPZ49897.1 McrBC 5-methylcytosine restriction system component [Bacteriovorax sp. BAL6_X]